MSNENQGHTCADRQQAASQFGCPNALGIVRHSTLWLKPEAVAEIAFLEWIGADHLRHTKFVALRDDKDPRKIVKET
jgi:ATP-dependent DNA ligase